jgi:hypothetical protein
LFLKIGTNMLLLHSLGILFDRKIRLKSLVNQTTALAPRHLHTQVLSTVHKKCLLFVQGVGERRTYIEAITILKLLVQLHVKMLILIVYN